jgi:hypothetical protein
LAACGGERPGPAAVERWDSAGVEIVVSPAEDRVLTWTFETEFSLGGEETDEESFYRVGPRTVGTDALGRIHVLDPDAYRVVSFDGQGRFLAMAGSQGDGPGELAFPFGLAVTPTGELIVADFDKQSLPRFRDGVEIESLAMPFPPGNLSLDWGDGALVGQRAEFTPEGTRRTLYRIGSDGDTTALARFQGAEGRPVTFESCGISITAMGPIFEPMNPWDASEAGVAYAPSAEYEVRFAVAGEVARVLRRALPPRPADRAAALASQGEGMRIGVGGGQSRLCAAAEAVDQRGFAPELPWIASMIVAPDGALWIRRFEPAEGEDGPIDLFDPTGAYVGTLPADAPMPIGFLPDGRVLVEALDEPTEIERIVVGRLAIGEAAGAGGGG